MFACATLHEMAHFFICYLTLGNDLDTPDGVSFLDYGVSVDNTGTVVRTGESGRWLENVLYGGCIEFYRDSRQGPQQVCSC